MRPLESSIAATAQSTGSAIPWLLASLALVVVVLGGLAIIDRIIARRAQKATPPASDDTGGA